MSDIRSAQTRVENFKGKSGSECESFIRSIRRIAWEEGKVQDKTWMAYFASIHFAGRALKWHSDLPPDAQQDWGKLEKALLERWSPPESSDDDEPEARTIPTPAAAAIHPVPKDRSSELGVLQLIFPDEAFSKSSYLGAALGSHGTCTTTTDINRALKLRWDRSPDLDARVLEWVTDSGYQWLALSWTTLAPKLTQGSVQWGRVTVADPVTLKNEASALMSGTPGPSRVAAWRVDSEGQVTPVWKSESGTSILGVFTAGNHAYVVADSVAYAAKNNTERRARLKYCPLE